MATPAFLKETETTPQEYALLEEMERVGERADAIRDAWASWHDFNGDLHMLTPPPEIVEAWDKIAPWLEQEGKLARAKLDELEDDYEKVVNWY